LPFTEIYKSGILYLLSRVAVGNWPDNRSATQSLFEKIFFKQTR